MSKKLSQITSGGLFNAATDTIVGVRSGTSDVLLNGIITGLVTGGTLLNVLDTVSFLDYNPNATTGSTLTTSFQNFLLDAQLKAYALKTTTQDDQIKRCVVRATCPRMIVVLDCPLIVPEYVALDCPGVNFRRKGTAGSVTTAYTGDTTSQACANLQQPTIAFTTQAHNISNLNIECGTTGGDLGSGVYFNKTWVPSAATLQAGGTGYSVNDVLTLPNVSKICVAPTITVNSVNGSGVILTFTLTTAGSYPLPPILQQQQWTAANGFTGSIAANAVGKVFDPANTGWYVTSGGTGSGAEFTLAFTPDFAGSGADYYGGAFLTNSTLMGDLNIQNCGVVKDATYGAMFAMGISGGNAYAKTISTTGGYYGAFFNGCTDIFWQNLNPVNASIGIKIQNGGSIRGLCTIDSPTINYIVQNNADNVRLWGDFLQKNSGITGGYCILMGTSGGASTLNSDTHYDFSMYNAGASGGIPAMNAAFTIDSTFNFKIANTNKTNSTVSNTITAYANLASTVKNCTFHGSIEGVSGSALTGTINTNNGYSIWDATNGIMINSAIQNPTGVLTVPQLLYPQTGRYYTAHTFSGKGTVSAPNSAGNSIAFVIPYFLSKAMTPVNMAMEVTTGDTTGATLITMGIYSDNNGVPGTLLVDIGTTATGTKSIAQAATGIQIMAIPAGSLPGSTSVLQPGWYWLGLISTVPTTIGSMAFKSLQNNNTYCEAMIGELLVQGSASPSVPAQSFQKVLGSSSAALPSSGFTLSAAGASPPAIWIGF